MDILDKIIDEKRKDYKCFNLLKELLEQNNQFRSIVQRGIELGKVRGFDEELWSDIYCINVPKYHSFEDIFSLGYNIGTCTTTSTYLSYIFNYCEICGGTVSFLKGTNNSPDGRHTWVSHDNKIIDTSLMLIIDDDYLKEFGYVMENHYNPNQSPYYDYSRDFARNNNRRIEKKARKTN